MSRFLKADYRSLEAYVPGEQPRETAYIKLNTNESPFPPAPAVAAALERRDVERLRLYPDPVGRALREKLAALLGVSRENLLLANGSDEILNFAFMAFPGKSGVRFPDVTYGFYPVFAALHGIPYTCPPLREDFTLDYRAYCGTDSLVVIANPNAPTGLSIPVSQIAQICASSPNAVVLIDEAYIDFGGESCIGLLGRFDNLLIARTFSKSRCLAGARLGYAVGSAELIADLDKLRCSTNPYNVNALTLKLGEAAVDADGYYREKCAEICRIRSRTAAGLTALGFTVLPSQTNFIFARTDAMSGGQLYRELKRLGILVRHFDTPRTRDFIRVTIGDAAQMTYFLKITEQILAGGSK